MPKCQASSFVLEFPAVHGFPASAIRELEISALCHEPWGDAMKPTAFEVQGHLGDETISALSRTETSEILNCLGANASVELEYRPMLT